MLAVLLAVFENPQSAEQVRTRLVKDGFPTDRVELTTRAVEGQAALQPGNSDRARLEQYFRTVLGPDDEAPMVAALVARVADGAAVITVHPRGDTETERAVEILEQAGAAEMVGHDLDKQGFEHAAADDDRPWIRYFTPRDSGAAPRGQ
jgi:hypothetical protein